MNVLICNNFVRHGSGVDAFTTLEARALRRRGHRVRFFGVENAILDCSGGLARARLLASTLYSFPAKRSLQRLLSSERFDVAYIHNTVPLLTGSVYDALRKHRLTSVQHLHNHRAFCLNAYAYRDEARCDLCVRTAFTACAVHRCYRDSLVASASLAAARLLDCAHGRRSGYGAQAYIASSAYIKAQHVRHGFADDCIWVLHNPSEDVAALLDARAPALAARRKKITFVGSLLRAKGVYALLDLAEAMPDWEVQLIGAGPEDANLKQQIAARRLSNVRIEGFLVSASKARAWHDSFVTLAPSLCDEVFPLVVAESYSLAIPVVSTGSGGMKESVHDGETGFIQSFRDPSATATLLRRLWEDESRYRTMRRAARRLYDAEFTEVVFGNRLEHLQAHILDVVGGRRT